MPIINRIGDFASDMTEWRRWMHRNPELGFDCHETAAFVAGKLREFGVDELHEGIAKTGLVAIINGQGDGPAIGLRADMDALPIQESTGADHASKIPGRMHACGHDGHTTMLLGAAKYLAETRNFKGRAALIFQPAEESGGGGELMVQEGIMDRFGIAQVYGIHNAPQHPAGEFYTNAGALMAAVDEFTVTVQGQGGHGAYPHEAIDPVAAAVAMVQAIQTVVSRNHKPVHELVVSVTQFRAGTANNVIPDTAVFSGTIRTFDANTRDMVFRRIGEIVEGHAPAFNVTARLDFDEGYPATVNNPENAAFAAGVAAEIVGEAAVDADHEQEMGAEDFSYMLQARPGAYLFLGQGDTAVCHHPAYDFNDEIAPIGASFFARLVERAQPVE
ncbi:MAG: M20 aminoacylase family protein [Rhodobacter sp.]|nr:M20 aminoacylase family protein [Rhodobacter sp.]